MSQVEKIVHGAVGVAKALTGIDRASDETIERRAAACMDCEHLDAVLSIPKCGLCGCVIALKVRVASETCPDDPPRW